MQIKFTKSTLRNRRKIDVESPNSMGQAGKQIFSALTSISSALAAISIIGYLIGWNLVSTYYGEIGAAWYPKTLPSTRVLTAGIEIYIMLTMMTVFGLFLISSGMNIRKFKWISACTFIGGELLLLITHRLEKNSHTTSLTVALEIIAIMALYAATGMMIALIAPALRDAKHVWNVNHTRLTLLIYTGILVPTLGYGHRFIADRDMDPMTSQLPHVQKRNCADCIWRIVDINEGKALLARISTIKQDRTFMLVSLDENWEITP